MKSWQNITLGVLLGLLAAGALYFFITRPSLHPVQLIPAPTPEPIQVQVLGSVKNPGIYFLPDGDRVRDAILAAGGESSDADLLAINLVRLLEDGERIYIPGKGEFALTGAEVETPTKNQATVTPLSPTGPVNINIATLDELDQLPAIGPSKAKNIITYRQEHGAYRTIDDLLNVPGIGPSIFESLKDLVTVGETE